MDFSRDALGWLAGIPFRSLKKATYRNTMPFSALVGWRIRWWRWWVKCGEKGLFCKVEFAIFNKCAFYMHFFAHLFAYVKKKQYLCTVLKKKLLTIKNFTTMTLAQINQIAKANIEKVAGIKLATCTACNDGFSIDFEINADAIARLRKAFKVTDYCEDECGFAYCGICF